MSDDQASPHPQKRSRLASILRRTWVGGALALAVVLLLWLAKDSSDGSIVLAAGTVLSLLTIFELQRMGELRGKGYIWTLVPAAGALFLLNWLLTRPYLDHSGAPHRPHLDLAEFVVAHLVVLLVASVALLELRFTLWKRPFLSLAFLGVALAFAVPEEFMPAVQPGWFGVGALAVACGAVAGLLLALARREGGGSPWGHLGFALWLVVPLPALVHVWWNWELRGLVALIVLSKVGDIAGYYGGNAFGRHHPFPRLSKGKTIEGCAASLLCGTLAGGVCVGLGLLPDFPFGWGGGFAAGLVVNLAAQAGDLLESAVKRRAGVKDSGTWFGPSGGALDLVDSLLLSVPTALVVWPLIFA